MDAEFDELTALQASARRLTQAATAVEQRAAAIEWLRAAIVLVGDAVPDAEGPGRLLEAALAGLDAGQTMPIVRRQPGKVKTSPAVALARGRAIAALDWLKREGHDVHIASKAVDDAIGMPHGTVERWRETSRSARRLNRDAAHQVPAVIAHWDFLASLPADIGLGILQIIAEELANDRPVHQAG